MNSLPHALWKKTKAYSLSLGFLLSPAALAEDLQDILNPSLSLRQGFWEHERSFAGDKALWPSSVWLNLRSKLGESSHVYLETYLLHCHGLKDCDESRLREAYLEYSWKNIDLKLGRQITVWGRADKLNPTDVFSTQNLLFPSPDDEDQRLGLGAAQVSLQWGPGRFIGLWQWEWQRPQFPLDTSLPPGVRLHEEAPADPTRQFGIKYDLSGSDWDGSLSYAQAYDRIPDLALSGSEDGSFTLFLQHKPITMLGTDFATTVGSYGFRAELAHVETEDNAGDRPLIKNAFTHAVLGMERNLIEDMNLNLQIFGRRVDNWMGTDSLPAELQGLARIAQRSSQQQHAWQDGLSLRWSYSALQTNLGTELVAVWNRQNEDSFLKPQVKYRWSDHWLSALGAVLYRGHRDTFFGSLRSKSSAFAEIRYQL